MGHLGEINLGNLRENGLSYFKSLYSHTTKVHAIQIAKSKQKKWFFMMTHFMGEGLLISIVTGYVA